MRRKKKNIVLQELTVEDYAAEGKSLARSDGKVIFMEGVVPGDVVDVRLLKNKKDWAEGSVLKFHRFSADRVDPFCPHFGVCGGCQWQMLPYEKQLEYKHRQVEEVLKRIGKVKLPPFQKIIGAQETRYYRNKLEYTFGNKRYLRKEELGQEGISGEQDVAGFHARGFFDKVVDIQKCFLQEEPTNDIRLAVKAFAKQNEWNFYDIRQHQGFMRNMQVRICTTGEIMVNIVVAENDSDKIELLMSYVIKKFPAITTLLYTVNTKFNDSLTDLVPQIYHGNGYVMEKLRTGFSNEEFSFKIGPTSFFQTNSRQGEQLYRVARDFAELTGKEIVYDLYCGTGSIGIFVSRAASKIIGVEMIDAAIRDARENALLNGVDSAEFFTGDVIDICNDDFFESHGRPDVIITDPPRAGMHEKLVRKILDMEAPIVVYVSCNPATQARDLNLLDEKYEVTRVQPVDMFPHTHHIENVVQLKRRKHPNSV
jgi:23S rRNA (uracil1939-C5)-methyltransferase